MQREENSGTVENIMRCLGEEPKVRTEGDQEDGGS